MKLSNATEVEIFHSAMIVDGIWHDVVNSSIKNCKKDLLPIVMPPVYLTNCSEFIDHLRNGGKLQYIRDYGIAKI